MVAESGGGFTRVTSRGEWGGAGLLLSGCGVRTRWPDADVSRARGGVTGHLWKIYRKYTMTQWRGNRVSGCTACHVRLDLLSYKREVEVAYAWC